jgi:hypothetical protein
MVRMIWIAVPGSIGSGSVPVTVVVELDPEGEVSAWLRGVTAAANVKKSTRGKAAFLNMTYLLCSANLRCAENRN